MKNVSAKIGRMSQRIPEVARSSLAKRELIVTALICIIVASGLSYIFYTSISGVKKDIVAIIKIEGPILDSQTASRYTNIINQAMTNESVKAVALVVDSPGGAADLIEQIYLDLLELNKTKTLVASVVMALSGGYYIAVAAEHIYVHNTSFVGNVGVIGVGPPILIPSEQTMETGAYKVTGFSKLLFPFNLSHALDNFVSAVEYGRSTAHKSLRLSSTDLRKGLVYLGSEAVKAGLADDIGSLQKAIEKAARDEDLVDYKVVELKYRTEVASQVPSGYGSIGWENLTIETLERFHPPPAIYYLYLPPKTFAQLSYQSESAAVTSSISAGGGSVLVDVSHGNEISWWELDILIAELAKRNRAVGFVSQRDDFASSLGNVSCLIVASPTEIYSTEESSMIEKFVERGGLLLVFFDPAGEYVQIPALFAPVNSLSMRFGLSFAKGYLYNEEEHFGIYRNIYVKDFATSPITQNLTSLVFFTAAHIHSLDKGVAWTSDNTYSSVAEKADDYATIVWVEKGNGTVVAFGDLTFLREPYCYVEDNYELILNLVSLITEIEVPTDEGVEDAVEKEVARPDLPAGTEKNYTEQENGEEHLVRWLKVNETLTRIERPDRTSLYHFNEDGSLWKWESDGMECIYKDALPEPPYPLTKGERWSYESDYTLTIEGKECKGRTTGEEEVEGFGDVLAGDNRVYYCAKVRYTEMEHVMIDGTNMTMITEGSYWVSSDAGTVKQEATTQYYADGAFTQEVRRTLLLKSIRKGA